MRLSRYTPSERHATNHAYLDRLTAPSDSIVWQLSADHGQKRELGDVTIIGGLDRIRPITEGREPINLQVVRLARVRYASDSGQIPQRRQMS